MQVSFGGVENIHKDLLKKTIFILVNDQAELDEYSKVIDVKYNGLISKALQSKSLFDCKFGSQKSLTFIDKDNELVTIILVGIGSVQDIKEYKIEEIGGKIQNLLKASKSLEASVIIPHAIKAFSSTEIACYIASGANLAAYEFKKYKTKKTDENDNSKPEAILEILSEKPEEVVHKFGDFDAIIKGVFLARDYISEPPNKLNPDSYSESIQKQLEPLDISVDVLGEREMRNLGMGALLGVGQGSNNESKMVVMVYNGALDDSQPIAVLGKGVTFDSGGISLKPAQGMESMKYDMSGSAAVVGLMKTLSLRKAKVNVVGVVALVENMPGGNAQRPSDIVTSMSGQTIEVLNTDAEGRLILADALWYTQDKFKPKWMIDLATLTGAIVVALGENTYAGLFSNDEEITNKLIKAGKFTNEKVWPFPLGANYDKMLDSQIADVANISNERGAGSITAAQFLQRFVNKTPWVHLDIAGMAWNKKGSSVCPKGAVGFGIKLLNQLIKDNYEA